MRRHALRFVRPAAAATATVPPEALKVGDALRSPRRRRITERDVEAYAGVSGDRNPVHLDDAFAVQTGGFERGRVVLVASHFPGAVYASQTLRFAAPVYVEDEVAAEVVALQIKAHVGDLMTGQHLEYRGMELAAPPGVFVSVLDFFHWSPSSSSGCSVTCLPPSSSSLIGT